MSYNGRGIEVYTFCNDTYDDYVLITDKDVPNNDIQIFSPEDALGLAKILIAFAEEWERRSDEVY